VYLTLATKEVRENAGIALLAIAALALVVLTWMGCNVLAFSWGSVDFVPFADSSFENWFAGISFVFAIILGFRQGAWETVRGTSVFLLHRPMAHRTIYATKLAVGLAILLTATGLALGTYSIWAATPGTHASPFFWSWTSSCWVEWFAATMVYCAAFLTGLRPARWFGSRLFPLLAIAFPVAIAMSPFAAAYRIALVILADAIALAAIAYVVRSRDYP